MFNSNKFLFHLNPNIMKKLMLKSFIALSFALAFLFFVSPASKAGPFGTCGKWVETSYGQKCIYHFFACECLRGEEERWKADE